MTTGMNALILSGLLLVVSCSDQTQNKVSDTADTAVAKVENKVDEIKQDMKENKDANFVKDVLDANTKELHLLSLGETKGTSKELRNDAKKMMPDHEKMGADMKAYADKKGIDARVDSSNMKSSMDDDKAGADWDKNWADRMVEDHQKTVKKFEDAQNDVSDPELKDMITKTLPTLRMHLDMALTLQGKMKK
ncbi:DUF4142 domain-containing protein [Chitinophagaceae bacterium MMS25-I14]